MAGPIEVNKAPATPPKIINKKIAVRLTIKPAHRPRPAIAAVIVEEIKNGQTKRGDVKGAAAWAKAATRARTTSAPSQAPQKLRRTGTIQRFRAADTAIKPQVGASKP